MGKKMCKKVKDGVLKDDMPDYLKDALPAQYVCKKCGRFSNDESLLCKGKKVKDV